MGKDKQAPRPRQGWRWGGHPTRLDKVMNLRQLAVMLQAGVPLPRALQVLSQRGSHPELREAWADVWKSVMEGKGLARAMAAHGRIFTMLEVGLVRAAERSSAVVTMLVQLADLLEREHRLLRQVTQALQYPLFLLTVALLGIVAFSSHLLPIFVQGLAHDIELPLLTRFLLGIANLASSPLFLTLVGGLALGCGLTLKRYVRTPGGRYQWHCALLRMYGVGHIVKQTILARLCQTLAVLIRSGMPLALCLDVAGNSLANYPLAEALQNISGDLKDGYSLSQAFGYASFFPRLLSRMLAISEETGDVATTLEYLGRSYEQQVAMAVEQLSQLLEPLMLAIVGTLMGIILIGMFMPIYACLGQL